MELNDYQQAAMETCMPTCANFSYMSLNLVGEVGEFASKVAKAIRKGLIYTDSEGGFDVNDEHPEFTPEKWMELISDLRKEAGDILWQLSGLCHVMGWTLEEVAQENLAKLKSRKERHVIDGDGDNR